MGFTQHPSEQALAEFISGELSTRDTRSVVRHLLTGCDECRRITGALWPPAKPDDEAAVPPLELRVDRLRARATGIAAERKRAEVLLGELEEHPQNRRMMLVINSRRFHSWFVAELVGRKVMPLFFRDPAKALEWGEIGVAIAERLSPRRYSPALINDMRARSWGALGNAHRVSSELVEAGEAFQKAEEALEIGTGDPLEEARFLAWRALYWRFKLELRSAYRDYDRALKLLREFGDDHAVGRLLADKGTALATEGDMAAAIRATEKAGELIDPERDPRAALAVKHNLSLYLHREGDIDRAMSLLKEILPLYARQNEPMVLLRLRWLEGRLAQTQREFRRAEAAFREVQRGFIERNIPYEAASVSFDLATILIEEERFGELAELASEILTVFRALKIPRETIAAIELFQSAIAAQRVGVSWVAELAKYVEKSQASPGQPFNPGVQK